MNLLDYKSATFLKSINKNNLLLLLILNCMFYKVSAEGTKEMTPSATINNVELQINRSALGGFASTFAGWTATSQNDRLFINVKDYSTEKIYVGFQKANSNQTVYYRIKRPDGTVVVGPTLIPSSGNGYISNWSEANIGPRTLTGNTGGYLPIELNLNANAATHYNGDYYIEFNTSNTTANTTEIFLKYYDVTVANGTNNTNVKKGRLWSYYWGFNSGGYTPPNVCVGSLFVYSKDSVVTEIDLNGLSPYFFRIFANSTGVGNTGNIATDRKSKNFGSNNPNDRPEFKIFLNDPDIEIYPSAVGGNRTATFNSISGCPGNYCLNFTINGDALAELKLDLNNNGVYTDAIDRVLEANVVGGTNCIAWDGLNGLGGVVNTNTNLKVELSTKVGTLHIPVYDAEQHTNGYLASIVRPSGIGTMTVYWDDNNLSGGSTNLTGTPATAPVGGSTTVAGQHSWMDPAGNQRTMNTWFTTKKTVSNSFNVALVTDGNPEVAPITGYNSLCVNTTINLSSSTTGGVWSSSNNAVATVNSSGVVNGITSGSVTISYTVNSTCGSTVVTKNLSITTGGSVAAIEGDSIIQTNFNTTLTDSTSGGIWASTNPAIATVDSNGIVTGIAPGTTTITYSVNNGCQSGTVSKQITVVDLPPSAINDTAYTMLNVPKNINPLTNDLIGSFAFNALSIEFLNGTAPDPETTGSFVINPNGTVTFTPVTDFNGTASIGYKIFDNNGQNTTAFIYVIISGNCLTDTDNDGINDCIDEYPNDPYKAFNNHYPTDGFATLMFEDLWPATGDYDFNDVVVDYNYNTITNGSNEVVEVKYTFIAKCTGAGLHNGFAFQLDGIPGNKITSVTGAKANGASWMNIASNGTESGQDYANVIVYDDVYKVLTENGYGNFINTYMYAPKSPYDTSVITVKFLNEGIAPNGGTLNLSSFPHATFNPYIIIGDSSNLNQIRSKELHLQNRMPTSKMDYDWFGKLDDNSMPEQGRFYKTKNNLPWALEISSSIPYMQEKQDISSGYLMFLNWAMSNGTSNTDWHLNSNGYRNITKIYTK